MENPLVSIIIPAYNAASVIERSCACALAQTVRDVEVIVIDDGSTDETAALVEGVAARDGRVHLLRHPVNRGRLEARRTGIEHASGTFTLFLDADDEILLDLAERLLAAQDDCFDIVQCNFELRYLNYISADDRKFNEDFNRPPALAVEGDDVTHVVFRDRRTTWSLCGKLMRTELLKRAIAEVPVSSLTQAEDACVYFIVSCFAQSYKGMPAYKGYIYNMDEGHSDARWRKMNLEQFSYTCRYVDAMDAIGAFLERTGRAQTLAADYETVRYEHVRAVGHKLLRYVEPAEKPQAYDLMLSMWHPAEVVAGMCDAGWEDAADCLQMVADARAMNCAPHEIKTVAALHYRMQVGGAERVAADLVNLWHDQGLRIVFFADEPREACAYELPDDVEWVELPPAATLPRDGFSSRARAIADAVERFNIDALVHHQWWSSLLAWEVMLFKTLGVPVCIVQHNIYLAQFYEPRKFMFDYARIARYVDLMVALSEFDASYWKRFNPRVRCTVNPLTLMPDESRRSKLTGKNVVWVGRLQAFDKQPQEAIEIMARVMAHDPECTLTLVGEAPDKDEMAEFRALVKQYGIADRVEFAGVQVDPAPYYERASVHLLTSRFDGWCLVLAESKARGVPCVMYDMPYLTLTQGNRGIMSVAQGDRDGAASAVSALLADEVLRAELGQEAFDHITEIAATDRSTFWQDAFADMAQGSPRREGFELDDAQWDLLIDSFKTSVDKALDCPLVPYAKRKGLKIARKVWHRIRRH